MTEFARHGGLTAHHRDGWGVAYYEDGDIHLLREPKAASTSPCVALLLDEGLRSTMLISHIRHATFGGVNLRNTQPFARELGGRMHVFAHNGHLPGIEYAPNMPLGRARPLGDTDSERAFCALLARLEQVWPASAAPALGMIGEVI
ncbi:MAG: class II glutamine amidotransferase, partial [Burkholderiales bacterium]